MAINSPLLLFFFKPAHFPYRKEKGCPIILPEQSEANELGKVLQEAELDEALTLAQKKPLHLFAIK